MIHCQARAVLTDIEGTTTDIAFVHKVLFPYARDRIGAFVHEHAGDPMVREQLDATAREAGLDANDIPALAATLERWIDEDRKITPLKALQGLIWAQGYADGDFRGHVYADAAAGLKRWHAAGLRLYVYSSGSVAAQKLIYGHSEYGDLCPLFSGYFDTTTGPKREPGSYARIAQDIGLAAAEIVFLSDVVEELDAARAAGMQTVQLVRAADMPTGAHPIAHSFDDIQIEAQP